jgi:hypothetical protein
MLIVWINLCDSCSITATFDNYQLTRTVLNMIKSQKYITISLHNDYTEKQTLTLNHFIPVLSEFFLPPTFAKFLSVFIYLFL